MGIHRYYSLKHKGVKKCSLGCFPTDFFHCMVPYRTIPVLEGQGSVQFGVRVLQWDNYQIVPSKTKFCSLDLFQLQINIPVIIKEVLDVVCKHG